MDWAARVGPTVILCLIYALGMLFCIGHLHFVPSVYDYWGPAVAAYRKGDYAAAFEYYDRIVKLRPGDFHSHYFRGCALGAQNDYEGALAFFDRALEIEPHDPFTLAVKAVVLLRLSRLREAVDVSSQFIDEDSSYLFVQYALGYHLLKAGHLGQAETTVRSAISADTTWALGYFSLGCVLSRSGRLGEAGEAYDRARALDPGIKDRGYESARLPIPLAPWQSEAGADGAGQACSGE